MDSTRYDAIVVGAGQGGVPLAEALAVAGMRTALVEREHVGGTCVNEGCTPTKTMVASARVAYLARRGPDYGVETGAVGVELARVRERKRAIVESFRQGSQGRIEKTKNLDLIFGRAQFTAARSLRVQKANGEELSLGADKIFVNAGCRPAVPKLDGLGGVPFLNSTSIMELERVPEHLVVLGGGYIGLEFGQMFRRFGSKVTVVQSSAQLLGQEDQDVARAVLEILRQDGIEVLLNAKTKRVSGRTGDLKLEVAGEGGERAVRGTHLLVATGRVPNTDSLKLEAAGIATDGKGFVLTNDKLETNVQGVYGLGDIKGGPAFTHISYDDFRILRANLIEKGSATTEGRIVPYTVFIDPQLGRVGLSETQARKAGLRIRVAKMPMNYVARALEVDETRGFMKAVVDANSGLILGAAVLGIEGGEIMSQLQIAMMGKLPYTALKDGVFAHPTLAESLNNLFGHFDA